MIFRHAKNRKLIGAVMFDVLEVNIKTRKIRLIGENKSERNASLI